MKFTRKGEEVPTESGQISKILALNFRRKALFTRVSGAETGEEAMELVRVKNRGEDYR